MPTDRRPGAAAARRVRFGEDCRKVWSHGPATGIIWKVQDGHPPIEDRQALYVREHGMAASDSNLSSDPRPTEQLACLSAAALSRRLDEEIGRAERHGTQLSCLLLVIDNLEEISRELGSDLPEQTLAYVGGALLRELRRFDRIGRPSEEELLIVLPGADGPRGEMVARRVLERVRAIKVEAEGTRRPVRMSVGLAAWRQDSSGDDLLAQARAATRVRNGENGPGGVENAAPPVR
jgi:diguanylate cyclase (GGDEF)-like protein